MACEVSAERVVAARAGEQTQALEAVHSQALDAGAVTPGLQHANIAAREALVTALRESLAPVAGRSRDITLIIPDASTRILLLDFDTLPEKAQDADAVVRFRLKKSLPFDVDASSVSFDRQTADEGIRVVAAVTPKSVLEEYESAVREAGYNPGAVLPSMIAALGVVDASRPTMVIKVEPTRSKGMVLLISTTTKPIRALNSRVQNRRQRNPIKAEMTGEKNLTPKSLSPHSAVPMNIVKATNGGLL